MQVESLQKKNCKPLTALEAAFGASLVILSTICQESAIRFGVLCKTSPFTCIKEDFLFLPSFLLLYPSPPFSLCSFLGLRVVTSCVRETPCPRCHLCLFLTLRLSLGLSFCHPSSFIAHTHKTHSVPARIPN